jgi:hypothetical protein
LPRRAASASCKSPVEIPRRYRTGSNASRLLVRRAQRGRIWEVNGIGSPASVPDLHALDLDRADARLDPPLRSMAMADEPCPAVAELPIGHQRQEGLGFRFDGLRQQPARP